MKSLRTILFSMLALMLLCGNLFAADLVGEWTETENWGARAGKSEHKLGDGDHFLSMENAQFTLNVTEQSDDKRSFHGEWCSANACEDLVGVMRSDGQIFMTDEDGYFVGALMGDNLEVCYLEANKEIRIANCRIMQRK